MTPDSLIGKMIIFLISSFFRLLALTLRVRVYGLENREEAEQSTEKGSFVMSMWHEHYPTAMYTHIGQSYAALASKSKDGEWVARIIAKLGGHLVRGSSSRGGSEAVEELNKQLDQGRWVAMAVDGPKGPRREAKPGIFRLSSSQGVPILPLIAQPKWPICFKGTWDQFKLFFPFSVVAVVYGKPLYIKDYDKSRHEDFQKVYHQEMIRIEQEAFRKLGLKVDREEA